MIQNEEIKHRVSTSFIKNKIWVNVYFAYLSGTELQYKKVKKIKISSENESLNYSKFSIRWDFLKLDSDEKCDTCEHELIKRLFVEPK